MDEHSQDAAQANHLARLDMERKETPSASRHRITLKNITIFKDSIGMFSWEPATAGYNLIVMCQGTFVEIYVDDSEWKQFMEFVNS